MQTGKLQSFGELSESGQWIAEFRPSIFGKLRFIDLPEVLLIKIIKSDYLA